MEQINGYYRIIWRDTRAFCQIYAPKEGGQAVSYKDLSNFLSRHRLTNYKEYDVIQAIQSGKDAIVPLGMGDGIEFSESVDTMISLDKMKITCIFTPPSEKGSLLNKSDLMAELTTRGVRFGIDEAQMDDFLSNRVYNTEYVFAQGQQPRHGSDARIEYFFNINPNTKPKHNEDGTVDYHDLNTICPVAQGQLLARLHPVDYGDPGYDVFGKKITPRTVKNKRLEYGANISLSEDGTEIYSDVTGHVTYTAGKVFVSNVYEVPADVDSSTGDINYDGSVEIRGSVRGGFSVVAEGDIIVEGAVEDALLQAGGNIIVKQGISGMQRGVVDAKGNVICKYIENAFAFAGGYIESGSIIYSEVKAGEDVIVADKKGFINGGVIRAGGKVEAHNIGSVMGSKTVIEVGMLPEQKDRFDALTEEIASLKEQIGKIAPVIEKFNTLISTGTQLDAKSRMSYTQLSEQYHALKDQFAVSQEEYLKLNQIFIASKHAKVCVDRDLFPGTEITISDASLIIKDQRSYCSIERKNGELVINSL